MIKKLNKKFENKKYEINIIGNGKINNVSFEQDETRGNVRLENGEVVLESPSDKSFKKSFSSLQHLYAFMAYHPLQQTLDFHQFEQKELEEMMKECEDFKSPPIIPQTFEIYPNPPEGVWIKPLKYILTLHKGFGKN